MPGVDHGIAIASARQLATGLKRVQSRIGLRPQRRDLLPEGRHPRLFPGRESIGRQAPEEAQARRVIARTRPDRQHADHLARGHVALAQLMRPGPVVLRHQAPQRAPRIGGLRAHALRVPAQRRARAIGGDHQIERPMPLARGLAHAARVLADLDDARAAVHAAVTVPRLRQQREQRPALHAQPEQTPIQMRIAHVHDRAPRRRLAIQTIDAAPMRQGLRQQTHLPQHLQPRGLQQEAGAHRPQHRRLFEDMHLMPVRGQQCGRRLAGGAIADHRDLVPVPWRAPLSRRAWCPRSSHAGTAPDQLT